MNRIVRIILALTLICVVSLSFSGCNLFAIMRENAALAELTTIIDTPSDDDAFAELNNCISAAFDNAVSITEDVSYSAGRVTLTNTREKAGLLADASTMLKNFIMNGNPGSSVREITDRADAGLLGAISKSAVLDYSITRNENSKIVKDDDDNDVTGENGDVVTEIYVSDNVLKFDIRYYTTEITTDTDGNENEEYTPADDATIESVFGAHADKETVIKSFDSIKDYLVLNAYDLKYTTCEIKASVDMETGDVLTLEFTKKMNVVASVSGAGSLDKYGDMDCHFELTQKTVYNFNYVVVEE